MLAPANHITQCMIADMEFSEADSAEDRALKLRMLEIYNKCVDECSTLKAKQVFRIHTCCECVGG
jgi:hypothetical protein